MGWTFRKQDWKVTWEDTRRERSTINNDCLLEDLEALDWNKSCFRLLVDCYQQSDMMSTVA